jgi:predicted DNA-binding protein
MCKKQKHIFYTFDLFDFLRQFVLHYVTRYVFEKVFITMSHLSVRLPEDLDQKLNEEARRANKKRGELVREAITIYIEKCERERFIGELVGEARAVYGNESLRRETMDLAEEFLPQDNEALDVAEGNKSGGTASEEHNEKWWK